MQAVRWRVSRGHVAQTAGSQLQHCTSEVKNLPQSAEATTVLLYYTHPTPRSFINVAALTGIPCNRLRPYDVSAERSRKVDVAPFNNLTTA